GDILLPTALGGPSIRIVILEVFAACDVAEDHRLGDPQLFRTQREVDVRDHQANEADAHQAVTDVGQAPRHIREHVRIAVDQSGTDTPHHHDAGGDHDQPGDHHREVIETVAKRV